MIEVTIPSSVGSAPMNVIMPCTRTQLESARKEYLWQRDHTGPKLFRGTPSRDLARHALNLNDVPQAPNGFEAMAWTTAVIAPVIIW